MINKEAFGPLKFMAKWDSILASGKLYLGILCLLSSISGIVLKLFEGQTTILLAVFGIILVSNSLSDKRRKF